MMISPTERQSLHDVFAYFAVEEFRDYSPLYRDISSGIAEDDALLALCTQLRPGQPAPNLIFAAVQYLLLAGDPATPQAEALAADRQALAKKALEEARATRSQTEAATKAAQDAQAEVQLGQVAVDQLASKLAELDLPKALVESETERLVGAAERSTE